MESGGQGSGYLDVSQLLLLLPVPDRQEVVVGIVHSAEEGAAVLRGEQIIKKTPPVSGGLNFAPKPQ